MPNLLSRFGNGINDLMAHVEGLQSDPMWNLGAGLLAAGGNRRGPKVSFGQGLLEAQQFADQRMNSQQQLQAQRAQLQAQKQRQNAMKGIQGLLGPQPPASIAAPAGVQAQRLQGLLAQANPQAYTNSLIQSQFAQPNTPAIPREAALAQQMFPGEPLETSVPKVMAMMNPQDPMAQMEADKLRLELESLIDERRQRGEERAEAEQEETQQVNVSQNSINQSISTIGGIAQNLNKIKGTMLQTGVPLPSLRRAASGILSLGQEMLGMDNSRRQELNTALDLVNKDLNGLILDTVQNFGERLTVQQTRILEEASANENITPQAIAKVLRVALDARKFAAQNDPNLSIENQDQIEAIESLLQEVETFGGSDSAIDWSTITGDLSGRNNP